jgi:type I restriction enzyme S subunit
VTLVFVPLSEAAEINPRAPKLSADTKVSFLPMADVSDAGLTHVTSFRRYEEVKTGYTAFQDKDVLVAKVTPCFENNKIAQADLPTTYGFGSTEFHVVRSRENADNRYLFHFLRQDWVRYEGERRMTGSGGQRRVPKGFLEELQIPLPSLPDQRRIAGILDQADALRRLRRQSLSRLSELGQAIFYEMFGDVAANPKGWPVGTIRDLLSEAKYGTAQKANTDGKGLPILRMGNLTYSGQLDLSDLKHVELTAKDFPKYTTQRGDLLFNRTNSKELVGKTAVVDLDDPLAIAGYLIRARTNNRGNPHYISAYLNSKHGKAVLRNMCKNIVGMANINAQELQDIVIALPPVELQNEFADRLAVIAKRREAFNSGIEQSDFLFAALQHRAFRGEL